MCNNKSYEYSDWIYDDSKELLELWDCGYVSKKEIFIF